jgi:hypothetical protein
VHFGVPGGFRVDVEVIWPSGGSRVPVIKRGIDPLSLKGKALEVRTDR